MAYRPAPLVAIGLAVRVSKRVFKRLKREVQ